MIADRIQNGNSALFIKFGSAISGGNSEYFGLYGILLTIAIAISLCFVFEPKNRQEGFTRGVSVFAVLTALFPQANIPIPQANIQNSSELEQEQDSSPPGNSDAFLNDKFNFENLLGNIIGNAHAANISNVPNYNGGIATVLARKPISKDKPSYSGLFGLNSFVNNKINFTPEDYSLPKGTKVEILDCWDTWPSGYRYAKIKYSIDGRTKIGWISTGRRPDYWQTVLPSNQSQLPTNCQ